VDSRAKEPVVIDTLNEGEVFGWSWLVPPYRYLSAARAMTPVSATALDSAYLRDMCEADTKLGYQLLKRVATVMHHHMQAARLRLLDL
jgi:CRP/FNR family cyclic AMP-dependent transcriptional regulator